MRNRTVKYADIIDRISDTQEEAKVFTRVIKAYMKHVAAALVSGKTFGIPRFGKFHVVAENRTSYNINNNVKEKTGNAVITPADTISSRYQYLPAVEFQKDNGLHNSNYYLNLIPGLWQPILNLIRENKLYPVEHGYQQESID